MVTRSSIDDAGTVVSVARRFQVLPSSVHPRFVFKVGSSVLGSTSSLVASAVLVF